MRDAIEIREEGKPQRLWDRRYERFPDPRTQNGRCAPAGGVLSLEFWKERCQRPEAGSIDREGAPPDRMPKHRFDTPKQCAGISSQRVAKVDHDAADAGRMAGQCELAKQLGDIDPERWRV